MVVLPELGGGLGAWHRRFVALFDSPSSSFDNNNGNTGATPEPKQKKRPEAETPSFPPPPSVPSSSTPPRRHSPPPRHPPPYPRPPSPRPADSPQPPPAPDPKPHTKKTHGDTRPRLGRSRERPFPGGVTYPHPYYRVGKAIVLVMDEAPVSSVNGHDYDTYWSDDPNDFSFDFCGVEVGADYVVIPPNVYCVMHKSRVGLRFNTGPTKDDSKMWYVRFAHPFNLDPSVTSEPEPSHPTEYFHIAADQTLRFVGPLVFPIIGPTD